MAFLRLGFILLKNWLDCQKVMRLRQEDEINTVDVDFFLVQFRYKFFNFC